MGHRHATRTGYWAYQENSKMDKARWSGKCQSAVRGGGKMLDRSLLQDLMKYMNSTDFSGCDQGAPKGAFYVRTGFALGEWTMAAQCVCSSAAFAVAPHLLLIHKALKYIRYV